MLHLRSLSAWLEIPSVWSWRPCFPRCCAGALSVRSDSSWTETWPGSSHSPRWTPARPSRSRWPFDSYSACFALYVISRLEILNGLKGSYLTFSFEYVEKGFGSYFVDKCKKKKYWYFHIFFTRSWNILLHKLMHSGFILVHCYTLLCTITFGNEFWMAFINISHAHQEIPRPNLFLLCCHAVSVLLSAS